MKVENLEALLKKLEERVRKLERKVFPEPDPWSTPHPYKPRPFVKEA